MPQKGNRLVTDWTWRAGAAHALAGQVLLFLSLHPLRDALDPHGLALIQTMSAVQLGNGLVLMLLAGRRLHPAIVWLIALGTAASALMIWVIVFIGSHPFDPAVPLGGMAMISGWFWLLIRGPGKPPLG